ncbi:MAG: hypothetical protein WAT39_01525 [Planctomycetota bacterium]
MTVAALPLAAQKIAEVEPNDTAATAQPIVPGNHITASYATAADEDWFSFTLTAPGQVHLHTVATGTLALGTSRDNRIAFYDATGTTRLAWNDGAVGSMADCGVTLPAGSYTARVALKTGTAGTYDLDLYVLPQNPIGTVEGPEPNGATGTPTSFTPGATLEGELIAPAPTDEDYWQFTLTGRSIVLAATYDDSGVPQADNLALRFHTGLPGAWTALGTSDATNSASHRITTLAHPGMLLAGTYAIAVKGGTVAAGTAPWDYTKLGKYALRTALIDMNGANTTTEGAEPNNTTTTPAGSFNLGDDLTGNTTGSLDEDWFLFVVPGPTTIGAMAEGTGATPLAGSSLRLYDSAGTLMTSASGSATSHGKLVYTIERPGIYFLSIAGPTVAVTGNYLLHTGGCTPLYVSNSTRVEPASTNACIGSNGLRPLIGYMSGETPAFGSTFITRVERTLASSFAVGMIGTSNTVAFGSIPLPFFIAWGGLDSQSQPTPCYVRVDPLVTIFIPTDAAGSGEYSYMFNYVASALGLKVYQQALCWDPTLNGLGLSVSNDASYVLGDRPF